MEDFLHTLYVGDFSSICSEEKFNEVARPIMDKICASSHNREILFYSEEFCEILERGKLVNRIIDEITYQLQHQKSELSSFLENVGYERL